jgi:hypothetical protein
VGEGLDGGWGVANTWAERRRNWLISIGGELFYDINLRYMYKDVDIYLYVYVYICIYTVYM